ncbi:hypothetical protein [Streptomyces bluensis]|uniref:hypothetical protein n=1 Tax=Streptomyces bluensis TaxID=33897 RepID=UPI00332F902B
MSEPVRWVIPAILIVAVLGVAFQLWWERRHPSSYPGSREHAGDLGLAWWRSLSTEQQAAIDRAAIIAHAEESAQRAVQRTVERAAEINAAYHP